MKILSIETSCDETAVSIVEAEGGLESPTFCVLGNALFSQIDIHKEYGGVYPMLAKREHAKNLIPLLKKVLEESKLISDSKFKSIGSEEKWREIENILKREIGLYENFKNYIENIPKPEIDVISVTSGPGLAPALWVGISFAKALSVIWDIPVLGVNHMEGHIASILIETDARVMNQESGIRNNVMQFPALALLISGGHTEIVKIDAWGKYEILGRTLDDAVGEAFDKTARMLGLSYPGGPEVSKLARLARETSIPHEAKFTRPMIHSENLDFSFSGLKTAVLYYIRDTTENGRIELILEKKADIAREFEDAVIDVLVKKTKKALEENSFKTLIIAGGVIANKRIADIFSKFENEYNDLVVKIPTKNLSTDNSLMIAGATYLNLNLYPDLMNNKNEIIAVGNLSFQKKI
ncbi:MAG: tRNA (adenosine(37)-N6)-threonylcarbamoyltransferase complex transferase subunit TsaD [Minisyncoccia bacterium]